MLSAVNSIWYMGAKVTNGILEKAWLVNVSKVILMLL